VLKSIEICRFARSNLKTFVAPASLTTQASDTFLGVKSDSLSCPLPAWPALAARKFGSAGWRLKVPAGVMELGNKL
jgi:hypothetical protein